MEERSVTLLKFLALEILLALVRNASLPMEFLPASTIPLSTLLIVPPLDAEPPLAIQDQENASLPTNLALTLPTPLAPETFVILSTDYVKPLLVCLALLSILQDAVLSEFVYWEATDSKLVNIMPTALSPKMLAF